MVFFHTADLHLGAGMEANMPSDKAAERRRELQHLFSALADEAEKAGAHLLIAGDLFDNGAPSPTVADHVIRVAEQHPGVDFLILRGNHDSGELPALLTSLPNVITFGGGRPVCRRYGRVAVYGCEDCTVPPEDFSLSEDDCNIVMLHGELRESASKDGINLRAWQERHCDYLALGHYHTARIAPLDSRGTYAYSGCPAGRGFDECGEKGYIRLDEKDGRIAASFVPLPGRRMQSITVDLTDCTTVPEIQQKIGDACREIPGEDALRVELCGELPPDLPLSTEALCASLSRRFWFVKIKSRIGYRPAADDLRFDVSLAGTFLKEVAAGENDPDFAREIMTLGLAALSGKELPF